MRKALIFIALFLLQIILCDFVNVGTYIYLCLIPLLLLSFPLKVDTPVLMFIGFGLGLGLDLLSDGVLGLNAASGVALGFARNTIFDLTVNKETYNKTDTPSPFDVGLRKYTIYLLLSILLYMLVYVLFDMAGVRPFFTILAKLSLSTIANLALSLLISYSLFRQR